MDTTGNGNMQKTDWKAHWKVSFIRKDGPSTIEKAQLNLIYFSWGSRQGSFRVCSRTVGVQKSRKHRGSCCSWRGEIITSTLSTLKNLGWHFSLPSSRIPPYQLHVTADLQSGPIWVNVRQLNCATAASPPCTYVTSLLAGHSNSQGSRVSLLPLLQPCTHTPTFTLVADPRKKGFYCSGSKENTAPY